jgi:hypothetical protein
MPDNLKKKGTESLEDRAWQDMLVKLDSNMPVQKGMTRRERWLLLLLLISFISTGAYILYNELGRKDSIKEKVVPQGEYAAKTPITDNPNDDLATVEYGKASPDNQDITSKVNIDEASRRNTNRIEEKTLSNIPEIQAKILVNSLNNKRLYIKNINNLNFPESISSYKRIPLKTYQATADPLQYHRIILEESRHPISLSLESIHPVFKNPGEDCSSALVFGSGLISENMMSFGGLEAGLEYYRKWNDHWYWQSGLNLHMFSKNGFANSLALTPYSTSSRHIVNVDYPDSWVEERYQYEVQNSEIVNNQVGAEYITGIVDQLYYLTLPINLMYEVKNTRFFAGMDASLLLRGTNKIHDYNNQYFNTVVLSHNVLEKRNYLNRVDLGVHVGIETKIWKNLYLYGKYNHGLIKVVRAESAELTNTSFRDNFETIYEKSIDQRVDFNRYFSLGVKYWFSSCR